LGDVGCIDGCILPHHYLTSLRGNRVLVEIKQQDGVRLLATLRTREPMALAIELTVVLTTGDQSERERVLVTVSKMIENLRYCGASSCGCEDCVRYQVEAIVSHCRLASCEVSTRLLPPDRIITDTRAFCVGL
jgi:hypothetical protein